MYRCIILVSSIVLYLGRLKVRISEMCEQPVDLGDYCSRLEFPDGVEYRLSEVAGDCLQFAQMYAELSIMRQLLLTDMASLLSEEDMQLQDEDKKKLENMAKNFLHLVVTEQTSDKELLGFLNDPLSHPGKRYIIAYGLSNAGRYGILNAYLSTLDNRVEEGVLSAFKPVMICEGERLLCNCYDPLPNSEDRDKEYEETSPQTTVKPQATIETAKSIYIPEGQGVNGQLFPSAIGPFFGPSVQNKLIVTSTHGHWKGIQSFHTDKTTINSIKFCVDENMNSTRECDHIPTIPTVTGDVELSSYHSIDYRSKRIKSFSVPNGFRVRAAIHNAAGKIDKNYGWFYGPITVNELCGAFSSPAEQNSWIHSFSIEKTNQNGLDMVLLCEKPKLGGHCYNDDLSRLKRAQGRPVGIFNKYI